MLDKQSEEGGAVMPETVISQLHLWARERHRLQLSDARVYDGFSTREEFDAVYKYEEDEIDPPSHATGPLPHHGTPLPHAPLPYDATWQVRGGRALTAMVAANGGWL